MVFQEPMTALNPLQTIGRQVAEVIRIHGASDDPETAAIDALSRAGLPPDRFPLEIPSVSDTPASDRRRCAQIT